MINKYFNIKNWVINMSYFEWMNIIDYSDIEPLYKLFYEKRWLAYYRPHEDLLIIKK